MTPRVARALRARDGFTLIELVVTLLVLGLATALALPAINRSTEGLMVRAEVSGFSAFLRRAREGAITRREVRVVKVDAMERLLVDQTTDDEVRGQRRLRERINVESEASAVRFSPEGLSSGGVFRVGIQGSAVYVVKVNPVTGRVTSQREPQS